MHRIDNGTQLTALPAPLTPSGTPGYFNNAPPGLGVTPTVVDGDWLTSVQEEIAGVVLASGQALAHENNAQLLAALQTLGRIKLTAPLNLYVATTGSDANNGLSSGSPFLTLQKAWNTVIDSYDLAGYTVTIDVANGTYSAGATCIGIPLGAGVATINGAQVAFVGNPSSPASVIISTTAGSCFNVSSGAQISIDGFTLQASGTLTSGLNASAGGEIVFEYLIFGACTYMQVLSATGAQIQSIGPYSIDGGAQQHIGAFTGGSVNISSTTVTLSATPAFSSGFAGASQCGTILAVSTVFTGGVATGPRYILNTNGAINTAGAGANYFPGNASGTILSGGQYV